MAVQTTPHTESEQNKDVAMDLEPNMAPQDTLRSDPKLYENSDGAQTAGNRSQHTNDGRDHEPKSLDEGTGMLQSRHNQVPVDNNQGVSNSPGNRERETQEKVLGK